MDNRLKIFIGYDQREKIAFHVLSHSIIKYSSVPVSINPICLNNLKEFYSRGKGPKDSTEFSISRFLTPYLSNYQGYSLFLDCDFIVNDDVGKLVKIIKQDPKKTIWCVKHNYIPKGSIKFLQEKQLKYQKKNWSSFMIYNNAKCRILTPKFISKANGLYLHQFRWVRSHEQNIGALPKTWNVLVGEQNIPRNFQALHFTLGGPYFKKFNKTKGSNYWLKLMKEMLKINNAS